MILLDIFVAVKNFIFEVLLWSILRNFCIWDEPLEETFLGLLPKTWTLGKKLCCLWIKFCNRYRVFIKLWVFCIRIERMSVYIIVCPFAIQLKELLCRNILLGNFSKIKHLCTIVHPPFQNNSRFDFLHVLWGLKKCISAHYFPIFLFLNKYMYMLNFYSEKEFKTDVQKYVFFTPQIKCKKSKWLVFWNGRSILFLDISAKELLCHILSKHN